MATLTEISVITRKSIIWVIGIIIAYLILRVLVIAGIDYYKKTHPVKVPPPNALFGKIQAPQFPKFASSSANLNFLLQNIEGKPPETTASAKVYFMPKKLPSLLAPQKAREFAAKLGFTGDPQILSATFYRFIDSTDNNRILDLDIVNLNFQLKYNYQNNATLFTGGSIPPKDNIIDEIKNYFQTYIAVDNTIFNGLHTVNYLKYNGHGGFNVINNMADANAERVDFFRPDLDELKRLPPSFNQSYNYVLLSPANDQKRRYINIAYTIWPVALDNFGTYPLITSQAAWDKLIKGEGYVANMGGNSPADQIIIRKIYLAYWDSGQPENYLQPIFVFEGDRDFAAYVPAIDPSLFE